MCNDSFGKFAANPKKNVARVRKEDLSVASPSDRNASKRAVLSSSMGMLLSIVD
jgi:hypothetical protein